MNRQILLYILFFLLIIPGKVEAQRWKLVRYEASVGVGTTHPFMDIGSQNYSIRSFRLADTRANVFTHVGFKVLEDLTLKLDLNYLMLGGSDQASRPRELMFTSNCFEHLLRVDYNLVGGGRTFGSTAIFNRKGMINNYGSSYVYVFAGGGGILSKAKVKYIGGEEAIDNPSYSNNLHWGFVIPAGVGYKLNLNSGMDLGFELGGRLSFSDWIDGYYNPKFSQYKDSYITTSFKAIFKIRNDRKGRPIFSQYGRR